MNLIQRPRRLRHLHVLRESVAETDVKLAHLMQPFFLANVSSPQTINGLAGMVQHNAESLEKEIEHLVELGLKSFMLFPVPEQKDASASYATKRDSLFTKTLERLNKRFGNAIVLATDVCLCSHTDHGHCGLLQGEDIHNDSSLECLADLALCHAQAGANMVAPSDMMDGRVAAIRNKLDTCGFESTPIMSYAVKYASNLYGPFRDAAHSSPAFGDRKSYQMDFRNRREALREAALDVAEGADILLVKPASFYLDIIRELHNQHHLPLAAYQVSGEYAMIQRATASGDLNAQAITLESWIAFRRAGTQLILTYAAKQAAEEKWIA